MPQGLSSRLITHRLSLARAVKSGIRSLGGTTTLSHKCPASVHWGNEQLFYRKNRAGGRGEKEERERDIKHINGGHLSAAAFRRKKQECDINPHGAPQGLLIMLPLHSTQTPFILAYVATQKLTETMLILKERRGYVRKARNTFLVKLKTKRFW